MIKAINRIKYTRIGMIIVNGIWRDNPVFCMILGLCSSLAITNRVENGIAMGFGVLFVLIASSSIISLFRNLIPQRVRMIAYMVVIATFVICVDRLLKAYFPKISDALGPYVGLIITNCIIMGRAEAFAINNPIRYSFLDALSSGLGYTYTLIIISTVRELLAFGTILNYNIATSYLTNWVIMATAPGGFFVLASYLWIMRTLARKEPPRGRL